MSFIKVYIFYHVEFCLGDNMFAWLYPIFPIAGGLLAMFFIYMLGFKRFYWRDFLLGLAILFICLGIQLLTPIQ